MTQRRPTGSDRRPSPDPGSSRPEYDHYAPGIGYTPPYPPPPGGVYGRGRWAWQRYAGLRQRARADSMSWWGMKALSGLLFGGGPFLLGVLILVVNALLGAGSLLAWAGAGFVLLGMLIMLRYALAPLTCKWIVAVPENRFYVVEDADGYTAEYLEPGRWIVRWRWNAKVRDYVDFSTVTASALVADVLGGNGPVVDLDVTVVMTFNPAQAEAPVHAQLRKMTTREPFETMIARDVRDIVRKHFRPLAPDQQRSALLSPHVLEEVVADQLAHYRAMGLTLASSRPVMVYVRSLPTRPPYFPPVNAWQNPPPEPARYGPPPDPEPPRMPADPPQVERTHAPHDEKEADRPPDSRSNEDTPTIKNAKNAQDPLTLRRRRRDRDRGED